MKPSFYSIWMSVASMSLRQVLGVIKVHLTHLDISQCALARFS